MQDSWVETLSHCNRFTMKGDALLDYAELQLSPRRTRCELFLSVDGVAEKLASGFFKPFLAHLRAAEAQFAKGSRVIRLEADLGISKQTNKTWFTKGTFERFVQFVSTPEVIERVRTIEDELAQLQQVRNALADTFVQSKETSSSTNIKFSPSGAYHERDGMSNVERRQSTDAYDNRGETSKKELLKAMDTRLMALKQEQNLAFSHATASGFDIDNMVDLMNFAKHFGADRLNDACEQFIVLFEKMKVFSNGRHEAIASPSEEPTLSSRSLASATEIHLPEESGVPSKLKSRKSDSWLDLKKQGIDSDFSERAVDVGFRLKPHEKVNFSVDNSVIRTRSNMDIRKRWGPPEKLQMGHSSSDIHSSQDVVELGHAADTKKESVNCMYQDEKGFGENGMVPLQRRECFRAAMYLEKNNASPQEASNILPDSNWKPLGDQNSETVSKVGTLSAHTQQKEMINQNDSLKKLEVDRAMDGEGNKAKNNQEESVITPVRRLSVQDAISIFEGKKKDSGQSPLKKWGKEEIRRGSMDSGSSYTSERAVLRRWSGVSLPSSGESVLQEKSTVRSSADDKMNLERDFTKVKDEANNLSMDIVPVAEEQKLKTLPHIVQSQQPEQSGSPASDTNMSLLKQGMNVQQLSTESISFNGPFGDIQKRAKTLTMEAPNLDVVCTVVLSKSEVDSGKPSSTSNMRSMGNPFNKSKLESQSVMKNVLLDAKGKTDREEIGDWNGQIRNILHPTLGSSVSDESKVAALATQEHDNAGYGKTTHWKHESVDLEESKSVKFNDTAKNSNRALSKARSLVFPCVRDHTTGNKSSTNLRTMADDLHMHTPVKMVNNQSSRLSTEVSPCGNRGRCYEDYRKLRDARLRDEHPAKRAERQAKLKVMQEILERRKEEMKAIAVRPLKKNDQLSQVPLGVENVQTQKSGLLVSQIEQKELGDEKDTDQEDCVFQKQDLFYESSNPTSPASTPRLLRNQASGLKPHAVKKAAPTLLKSSTPPRNSIRSSPALSPKSAPKNPLGTPGQWKSPAANHNGTVDASIIKSVPILLDVRKETAKSSSARAASSARAHPKVSGRSQNLVDTASLDGSDNSILIDDAIYCTSHKEETKHQLSLMRKSCTHVSEYKIPSFDETISGSLKGQQEGLTELTVNGRVTRSAPALTQQVKPFLRKGQGIGPGAGLGIMKQKASVSVEASKSSNEGVTIESMANGEADDLDNLDSSSVEAGESKSSLVTNNLGSSVENGEPEVSVTSDVPVMHISNNSRAPSVNDDMPANIHVGPSNYLAENALNHDRACHSTFYHDDVHDEKKQCHSNGDSVFKEPSSDLIAQTNTESFQNSVYNVASSGSFRPPSLLHEHVTSPFYPAAAPLANSTMLQPATNSGYSSSLPDIAIESLLNSPTMWNPPQTPCSSEANLVCSTRQFSGPQKAASIITLPPKESAKGFKRLLHFGRKRAAETTTTDCVSASTTSEGDDDTEEARDLAHQASDEFLQRIRLQERGFDSGSNGDHNPFQEQVAIQLLRSSIPGSPANFKLREDTLSAGTLVKAPRSFFSLSSFRSGKSR